MRPCFRRWPKEDSAMSGEPLSFLTQPMILAIGLLRSASWNLTIGRFFHLWRYPQPGTIWNQDFLFTLMTMLPWAPADRLMLFCVTCADRANNSGRVVSYSVLRVWRFLPVIRIITRAPPVACVS